MAEYVYPLNQTVAAGQNVLLQDSIPCNRGYVIHRNGSGMYGHDPEEEMYSSMGYYGRNSRSPYMDRMPAWSGKRDSMGRYSSMGYSRDEANHKLRADMEMKLASATDEREREAIMKCLRALDA